MFVHAYPTPQAAQAASCDEIIATLRSGKHSNPLHAAPEIVEELRHPQVVASAVIVRAKSRLMLALAKHLLVVIEDIAS